MFLHISDYKHQMSLCDLTVQIYKHILNGTGSGDIELGTSCGFLAIIVQHAQIFIKGVQIRTVERTHLICTMCF